MDTNFFEKPVLGLFGGTFDPFHFGHLVLCLSLYAALPLKAIQLIPSAYPLLKKAPVATAAQRLDMLRLVCRNSTWLTVNDLEIRQGGLSRTVETLTVLREDMPDTPLCFMMSMDQFLQFDQWYCWEKIPELVHLIVANRPEYPYQPNSKLVRFLKTHQIYDPDELTKTLSGSVLFQSIPALPISGTQIRNHLGSGKSIQGMVPESIFRYITQNRLYSMHVP